MHESFKGIYGYYERVRRSSIYMLIGKIVIGEVAYADNQTVDKTRLWHMRLGHVSEKGLQELGKQNLLGGDKIDSIGFCEQCGWERPRELNLALEQTKQRKFWNVSIKIYGGHLKPLLIQMADILY